MKRLLTFAVAVVVAAMLGQFGCAPRAGITQEWSTTGPEISNSPDAWEPPAITMRIDRMHKDAATGTWVADGALINNTDDELFVNGVDLMLQFSNTAMVDARGVRWANDGHPRACVTWRGPPTCGVALPAHSAKTVELEPYPGSHLVTTAALYAMNREEQEPPSRVWYVTRGTVETGKSLGASPSDKVSIGGSGAADVQHPGR